MTAEPPISAWPLPPSTPRALLVGGSFDPPHAAHVAVPVAVRDAHFPGAAIVFVPARVSPFKTGRAAAPELARLEMLRLAIQDTPLAAAWSDEIDRLPAAEPSFTVDTLRRARSVAPHTELFLVMGADQAAAFHRWREPREILSLARPVVLLRSPLATPDALAAAMAASGFWSDDELANWRSWCVSNAVIDMSSTRVREIVASEGVDRVPAGWLAPAVREYIRARGLYRQ